jgi:hypothetical protein
MAKPKWTLLHSRLDDVEERLERWNCWLHHWNEEIALRSMKSYQNVRKSNK